MKLALRLRHLGERLPEGLLGAALLFAGTTVVNLGNYAFNLILGRWLGPVAFADISLIVTLFLVVTFVTVALQMTAAKFAAVYSSGNQAERLVALRRWLGGYAWLIGLALLALFGLGAPLWQRFFHTASALPFVIFAIGIPFAFAQGVDRGVLQGQTRFVALAGSYQAEMWARLLIAVALVALGWSVGGATMALTLSLLIAWAVARWSVRGLPTAYHLTAAERANIARFVGPVAAALIGQILINNSDVLIVKHFFSADEAGLYAALALIGRIVFFATWSVVTVLFPIVARRHAQGAPHRSLLYAALAIIGVISAMIVATTVAVPELIVGLLFGAPYVPIAPLLAPYAIATALYALANVVVSYRLSLDDGNGSRLALLAGVVQALSLWLWHDTLREVVLVQIAVMAALLVALLAWDGWLATRRRDDRWHQPIRL